jgi:hypothetical protein
MLLTLGERTGMIPRDTIHHITRWNPQGHRERTYTGKSGEIMLGLSVRTSLGALIPALDVCAELCELIPGSQAFTIAATVLAGSLKALESSVDSCLSAVSPEFFAGELRAYLQEVKVGGLPYFGPAAAHIPLPLVDLVLWACDRSDIAYHDFWRQTAQYGMPQWQPLYARFSSGQSIVSRLAETLRGAPHECKEETRVAAEAVCRALRALLVFRGKHLILARRTYTSELTDFQRGSAGGDADLLGLITKLTRENAAFFTRVVYPKTLT